MSSNVSVFFEFGCAGGTRSDVKAGPFARNGSGLLCDCVLNVVVVVQL